MGKEALVVLAALSQLMAAKLDEPVLHFTGWVNSWIAILVAMLYSSLLCGAQAPIPLQTRESDFLSGLG